MGPVGDSGDGLRLGAGCSRRSARFLARDLGIVPVSGSPITQLIPRSARTAVGEGGGTEARTARGEWRGARTARGEWRGRGRHAARARGEDGGGRGRRG